MFLMGQSINDLTITSSINCYGDFECVDIEFQNLDNNSSYDLWVWRDIGDGTFSNFQTFLKTLLTTLIFHPLQTLVRSIIVLN
jgi:hypothetical protein